MILKHINKELIDPFWKMLVTQYVTLKTKNRKETHQKTNKQNKKLTGRDEDRIRQLAHFLHKLFLYQTAKDRALSVKVFQPKKKQ